MIRHKDKCTKIRNRGELSSWGFVGPAKMVRVSGSLAGVAFSHVYHAQISGVTVIIIVVVSINIDLRPEWTANDMLVYGRTENRHLRVQSRNR